MFNNPSTHGLKQNNDLFLQMYWFVGETMVAGVVYYYITRLGLSLHIPEMAQHASHSSGTIR